MNILVTGGAGFIGSNFLNEFVPRYPECIFINFDKLTYAANLLNLKELEKLPNYIFERGDLAEYTRLASVFAEHNPRLVIHFAAESHVDRSISGPAEFIKTNILGTFNLLEVCRQYWGSFSGRRLLHVSTDEVYGSLGEGGLFTEKTPYDPSSPYSASKASADHLVRAYYRTYGLPAIITNCSNNYGPCQFPEKLIPLMILNALEGNPLPVYGRGENIRDWIYVRDHCQALWSLLHHGRVGETYNIGGNSQWKNLDVVLKICEIMAAELNQDPGDFKKLITFVKDRPGHDLRYAVDSGKITGELGWGPQESFTSGLQKTVKWYLDNGAWVKNIKTGAYAAWIERNYTER